MQLLCAVYLCYVLVAVCYVLVLCMSGTHGLNEELGRHRGKEGKTEYYLLRDECGNVSHVL